MNNTNNTKAKYIDVRTPEEVVQFAVPGALTVDLQSIADAVSEGKLPDALKAISCDTPLFVFCVSGGRAQMALHLLEHAGFSHVQNIGGISEAEAALK